MKPTEGTVVAGTLKSQDLLRAWANELARLEPGKHEELMESALTLYGIYAKGQEDTLTECIASLALGEIGAQLNRIAGKHGMRFGAHEGDGADFGFWKDEES